MTVNPMKLQIKQVEFGKYQKIYYIRWKVHKTMSRKFKSTKLKYVKF